MNERRRSYTQVGEFFRLADRYIAVLWAVHEPYEFGLDIYDFHSQQRVVANFVVPGKYVRARGDFLYFLEERESESEADNDRLFMHIYRLKVD